MRKLASIRKVSKLLPIEGADRIEIAQIDGWQCIVKKGEMQEGSLCVYFEIDSFLPKEEIYSFMPKLQTFAGKEGYRVKTMKMRGTVSQGLALPTTTFWTENTQTEGDDVTEQLGIIKYDTELTTKGPMSGTRSKGTFPAFIPKTDQERIQNLISYWKIHPETEFEETLKLDGSSMTCYKIKKEPTWWDRLKNIFSTIPLQQYHFGVCSRNLELQRTESNFWKAANKYRLEQHLPEGYAVQGELIAPNIQANHEKVQEVEYYIFSVFDIAKQKHLSPKDKREFIAQ